MRCFRPSILLLISVAASKLTITFMSQYGHGTYAIPRSALFLEITQVIVVILYRRFGRTYQSLLQGSTMFLVLKMGSICCPETSVNNCHCKLSNMAEDHGSNRFRCGSLK
jgi:hypothetical protein